MTTTVVAGSDTPSGQVMSTTAVAPSASAVVVGPDMQRLGAPTRPDPRR